MHAECLMVNGGLRIARTDHNSLRQQADEMEALRAQIGLPLAGPPTRAGRKYICPARGAPRPESGCRIAVQRASTISLNAMPKLAMLQEQLRVAQVPLISLRHQANAHDEADVSIVCISKSDEMLITGCAVEIKECSAEELEAETARLRRRLEVITSDLPSMLGKTGSVSATQTMSPKGVSLTMHGRSELIVVVSLMTEGAGHGQLLAGLQYAADSLSLLGPALRGVVLHLRNFFHGQVHMHASRRTTEQMEDAIAALHELGVPIICYADTLPRGLAWKIWLAADHRMATAVPDRRDIHAQRCSLLDGPAGYSHGGQAEAVQFASSLAQHPAIGIRHMLKLTREKIENSRASTPMVLTSMLRAHWPELLYETSSSQDANLRLRSIVAASSRFRTERLCRAVGERPVALKGLTTLRHISTALPERTASHKGCRSAGPHALEVYVPRHCASASAIAGKAIESLVSQGQSTLMERFTLCGEDEDAISLGLTALHRLMKSHTIPSEAIGQLWSSCGPLMDRSKSAKSELMASLANSRRRGRR